MDQSILEMNREAATYWFSLGETALRTMGFRVMADNIDLLEIYSKGGDIYFREDVNMPWEQNPLDLFFVDGEYKNSVETVTVGGYEIPVGTRTEPSRGTRVYTLNFGSSDLVETFIWKGTPSERRYLDRGLVHLDKDSAFLQAKAAVTILNQKES